MRPLLKVLIPYLLIGLGIVAVYFIATECLPLALSDPQGGPSPADITVERRAPVSDTVPSISQASEAGVAPSATPEPPAAWSRPGLTPPPRYADLQNAARLEEHNPEAAAAIRSLPWVRDGIADEEREAAESLIYMAATQEELFNILTDKPWVDTAVVARGASAIVALDYIAERDPQAALRLIEMPLLDTLEAVDALALESLAHLAVGQKPVFNRVMRHPAILDGIDENEASVITLVEGVAQFDSTLVGELLDPSKTHTEHRLVDLPLAGPVTLAITRTGPGAARSMDLLEESVRFAEDIIGRPFPADYVPLLFEEAVPGYFDGTHNGLSLTIVPDYDVDDGSYEAVNAGRVIAHEVSHYYWRHSEPWLDEGAAEFTASLIEHIRTGHPLEPVNYPCGPSQPIARLEQGGLSEADPGYACNYATGERLFMDLFHSLGEKSFLLGLQRLYDSVSETSGGTEDRLAGIAEIRNAFEGMVAAAVVIDRWYAGHGQELRHGPDNRPVVAVLPEVSGWVNRAYVSLEEAGSPVGAFAPSDAGEWAWLTLEYSHDYAGPPTELTFEVVEYFEDGFPYRRDTLTIEADRKYSGGVQWLSIGPGPGRHWAPGRHWVYVHHEGRKVAQVEFEVTP